MTGGAFLHYCTLSSSITLASCGVALGISKIATAALQALYQQPSAHKEIARISILAMAITETGGIIGFTMALMILFGTRGGTSDLLYPAIARLGILFVIGVVAFIVGIVSAQPARQACLAVSRQPFYTPKILNLMLITMSIIQTPAIFGFIVATMINRLATPSLQFESALALLASGICFGLGAIGPALGQGIYAAQACNSVGKNRESYRKILTFSLISHAIIESPLFFSLLISLLIMGLLGTQISLVAALTLLGAGLAVGCTNIAPGISSGKTSASACNQIGQNVNQYTTLARTSLLVQVMIDTIPIYGLIIGLMLLLAR